MVHILPNPKAVESNLRDKKFVAWANGFLRRLSCEVVYEKKFGLVNLLNRSSAELSSPLFDIHWKAFWKYNFESQGSMDITRQQLFPFVEPLARIFHLGLETVVGKHNRKKRKQRRVLGRIKRKMDASFRLWANSYLRRIWFEVVAHRNDIRKINGPLWHELVTALKQSQSDFQFADLNRLAQMPPNEFVVENEIVARGFFQALWKIYTDSDLGVKSKKIHTGSSINNKKSVPFTVYRPKARPRSDLETAPEEVIDVILHPVELPSKIGTRHFADDAIRILTTYLKTGIKWVSSEQLSKLLRVDQREFEQWADKHPQLQWKRGESKETILYYGLRPVLFPLTEGEPKMTQKEICKDPVTCWANTSARTGKRCSKCNEPATHIFDRDRSGGTSLDYLCCTHHNETVGEKTMATTEENVTATEETVEPQALVELPAEQFQQVTDADRTSIPAIGTQEFDTFATQFFSQGKAWRSLDAISAGLRQDKDVIQKWADANPSIARRPSKENAEKLYYCLLSRIAEKDEKKEDDKKGGSKSGTTAKAIPVTTKTTETTTTTQKKTEPNSSITIQELAALAMLHSQCDALIRTMDFYANRLATRHEEAFAHLTKAQKQFSSGVALLQKALKVDDAKLPALEKL